MRKPRRKESRKCTACGERKSWLQFSGPNSICHKCSVMVKAGELRGTSIDIARRLRND